MTKKLLIIPADNISSWISKGEVIDRYFNPENFFDEIHLLLLNDDKPDLAAVKKMTGNAKVHIHNFPPPNGFFKKSIGWQPWFLNKWVNGVIPLIKNIAPDLIRCHGAQLNSYIALKAKLGLGIPYVVSLHINPDVNIRGDAKTLKDKIITWFSRKLECRGLKNADRVLPVYEPIVPYLDSMGIDRYQVCYNVLNATHLLKKESYQLSSPVKIISIGRQFKEKNPRNIIKALKALTDVEITFVGDGDLHEELKSLSKREGVDHRTIFVKSMPNDDLCKNLHSYDFLALHTEYFEISKVILEAFLVGLPVLLNHRIGDPVPELSDNICLRVSDTVEGYFGGLKKMIVDHSFRESLGKNSYKIAQDKWAPAKCERVYVDVYKRIIHAS